MYAFRRKKIFLFEPIIPKLFTILKQNNNYLRKNIIIIEKMKIRVLFTISHKSPNNCIILENDSILLI